jgi:hypothetical protein
MADRPKLDPIQTRRFVWYATITGGSAGLLLGTAIFNALLKDWKEFGVAAFCFCCLAFAAYTLTRTAVRSIN